MDESTARPYVMTNRAESVRSTRLRITQAAIRMHETIGPARTTISAIAQEAGVQRQTVYRHFEDESQVLAACSAHYWAGVSTPDVDAWAGIASWSDRLSTALADVYAFHATTEPMLTNVLRDAEISAPVRASLTTYGDFMETVVQGICADRPSLGDTRRGLVAHAVDFRTWYSLARRQGLEDGQIIEAMSRFIGTDAEG